jgi:hypothetical protein
MIKVALAASAILLATVAFAQEDEQKPAANSDSSTLGQLIAQGYEIKAAVPNGKRFVVFLQKDSTGYACEMTGLSTSRCGKIN